MQISFLKFLQRYMVFKFFYKVLKEKSYKSNHFSIFASKSIYPASYEVFIKLIKPKFQAL